MRRQMIFFSRCTEFFAFSRFVLSWFHCSMITDLTPYCITWKSLKAIPQHNFTWTVIINEGKGCYFLPIAVQKVLVCIAVHAPLWCNGAWSTVVQEYMIQGGLMVHDTPWCNGVGIVVQWCMLHCGEKFMIRCVAVVQDALWCNDAWSIVVQKYMIQGGSMVHDTP